MTDVREFDAAYHLDNPTALAACLGEAFATGDNAFIALAIRTVARARRLRSTPRKASMRSTSAVGKRARKRIRP